MNKLISGKYYPNKYWYLLCKYVSSRLYLYLALTEINL